MNEGRFDPASGLICAEGESWKEHRRFVMAVMKQLGMGRSGDGRALMEARVMDGVLDFVQVERLSFPFSPFPLAFLNMKMHPLVASSLFN